MAHDPPCGVAIEVPFTAGPIRREMRAVDQMLLDELRAARANLTLPPVKVRQRLRERAGLSYADMAKRLGVRDPETVRKWEAGWCWPNRGRASQYLDLLDELAHAPAARLPRNAVETIAS
jgi:DNA-binding transcriptional regulator YiaG